MLRLSSQAEGKAPFYDRELGRSSSNRNLS